MREITYQTPGLKLFFFTLLITLSYFPIFLHLDSKPLREWDEARNAINAFEMSRSHNLVVKTYQNEPDLWETKPPLLVWMQVVCFKLFGYNELAVRLPSALATMTLVLFLFNYFLRHFKNPFIGLFASLILLTSGGYMHEHAARTGDHDALLVCFEMLMLLSFFMYIETGKRIQLILFSICLMLAIYTKSIAVFMFLPGIILYLILTKQLIRCLKNKNLWLGFISAITGALIYYSIREMVEPGYFKAVWENELFPRYFNTATTYQYAVSDFWFYFRELKNNQFSEWISLLVPAIIINILTCKELLKKFHHYVLIITLTFFLIISKGTTNVWYDLPLIPLMSIIIGIALYQLVLLIYLQIKMRIELRYGILLLASILLFLNPYRQIISKVMNKDETNTEVQYAYVLKHLEKTFPDIRTFEIYNPSGSNYPLVFYRDVMNLTKNYTIQNTYKDDLIPDGRYLVVLEQNLPEIEDSGIPFKIIFKDFNCYFIQLK